MTDERPTQPAEPTTPATDDSVTIVRQKRRGWPVSVPILSVFLGLLIVLAAAVLWELFS